jgi:hypothetical protein
MVGRRRTLTLRIRNSESYEDDRPEELKLKMKIDQDIDTPGSTRPSKLASGLMVDG